MLEANKQFYIYVKILIFMALLFIIQNVNSDNYQNKIHFNYKRKKEKKRKIPSY